MGKLKRFVISLFEGKEIYHAGEQVHGQVDMELEDTMRMKGLRVSFVGKARVDWDEGSGDNKRSYWANQEFFHEETFPLGSGGSHHDTIEVEAGFYTYPFNFQLPNELPSSYEDKSHEGFIRYYVKASIIKPWKFDHNVKKVFTVLDVLDLNTMPNMLASSGDSKSKSFCCLCCADGPIELTFYLDRTGYVSGEWITINAEVTNASDRTLTKTTAELARVVTYRAQGNRKRAIKSITKLDGLGCESRNNTSWNDRKMQIPALPPTETRRCDIIDVEYMIKFTVQTPAFSINLQGEAPIIIGTVPIQNLHDYATEYPEGSTVHVTASQSTFSTLPPLNMPQQSYSTLPPPPSYAAAVEGSVNIRERDDNEFTMGEMDYTPHYTYYDWGQSYQVALLCTED